SGSGLRLADLPRRPRPEAVRLSSCAEPTGRSAVSAHPLCPRISGRLGYFRLPLWFAGFFSLGGGEGAWFGNPPAGREWSRHAERLGNLRDQRREIGCFRRPGFQTALCLSPRGGGSSREGETNGRCSVAHVRSPSCWWLTSPLTSGHPCHDAPVGERSGGQEDGAPALPPAEQQQPPAAASSGLHARPRLRRGLGLSLAGRPDGQPAPTRPHPHPDDALRSPALAACSSGPGAGPVPVPAPPLTLSLHGPGAVALPSSRPRCCSGPVRCRLDGRAQMKKKSGFQITSVTPAQNNAGSNNSIAEDTESYDDMDESHTEDLSSSEILDVSRATDYEPERSSSEETLNNVGDDGRRCVFRSGDRASWQCDHWRGEKWHRCARAWVNEWLGWGASWPWLPALAPRRMPEL
ncbi:uncharacterized protein, partial [Chiloscyllium punctatum]|uniref:uncharacterized protein n=1 Tax=Chiloscyllium punctatum TaxID=137246 RepID=UPI003B63804D